MSIVNKDVPTTQQMPYFKCDFPGCQKEERADVAQTAEWGSWLRLQKDKAESVLSIRTLLGQEVGVDALAPDVKCLCPQHSVAFEKFVNQAKQ